MKYILTLLAFLFCGAAQAQDALVVATCGTLPLAYAPGATRLLTVDTTGKLCGTGGGGGGSPGGTANQIQYNAAGSFGGFTMSGDATLVPATGVITMKNTGPGITGPIGSTTTTPVITIDAQGRVTALTSASIAPTGGAIQPISGTSSTVPGMTAGAAVSDTDVLYAAQSSGTTDRKVTGAQVKTYANTSAVRATTTTSEALANSDQNKLVTFSNAGAVAATIAQAGSGGNFAAGWAVSLRNLGAGTVTLTPATSTVDGNTTVILCPGQGIDLYSDGTNYFTQAGRGTIVACGTLALATSAIASATCTSAQTFSAPGLLTTDVPIASFNSDPTAVTGFVPLTTGMLTIIIYPTANTINVKECNNTLASITPGAMTLNLKAVR